MSRLFYIVIVSFVFADLTTYAQTYVKGKVTSKQNNGGIPGAEIRSLVNKNTTTTNDIGEFSIQVSNINDTLLIKSIGYQLKRVTVKKDTQLFIELDDEITNLNEVEINTGIYKISPERSTGAFTYIDKKLLNRSVGSNIIDRLEGITNGLNFDRRSLSLSGENTLKRSPDLKIHGTSTIESNESPLIIIDNFPYEGDLNSINPNDIESVTVLKDAASASIWGARAGNGIIVLTTKQGKYNGKTSVSFTGTVNLLSRPDLSYNKNRLPATTVMEIEKELFNRGAYIEDNAIAIPLYVELLIKKRDGSISDTEFNSQQEVMRNTDITRQAKQYLYRAGVNQQYAINLNGGGSSYRYYLSAGNDWNKSNITGNSDQRLTLNIQNVFRVTKGIEISASAWYTKQRQENNGIYMSSLGNMQGRISSYALLSDVNGNPGSILKDYRYDYLSKAETNGLLNWLYKPLEDRSLSNQTGGNREIRLNGGVKYKFLDDFNLEGQYQYIHSDVNSSTTFDKNSYYVRNLVNKFTQSDGTRILPYGGILEGDPSVASVGHSGRVQLNYNRNLRNGHQITALAGSEIRELSSETSPGYRLFNYNESTLNGTTSYDYYNYFEVRPEGYEQIPSPSQIKLRLSDRFLSYYANASDTYLDRYTIYASVRKDASNIFGVNINQKGVPLWSVGGSWDISKEKFYHSKVVGILKLRATYGSSGNVNKGISVFPTAIFDVNSRTNLINAALTSAGNPNLRWEKVKTFNLGLDAATPDHNIQFTFDYYIKNASDLIGLDYMDPTTGIIDGATPLIQNKINYAGLKTKGVDIIINTRNLTGKLRWETTAIINYVTNKITHFRSANSSLASTFLDETQVPPVVGVSKDMIYALPWHGLNPDNGQPLIFMDGKISTDYSSYYQNYIKPEDLVQAGVTSPPFFGSLRNVFSFKGFHIAALVTFKAGYVFRRSSMEPGAEWRQSDIGYHMDYFNRWKSPGDETKTQVPGQTEDYDVYRAKAFSQSEALITKADHIRLQDIEAGYTFNKKLKPIANNNIRVFFYGRNLGLIWKANKYNIDPDFTNAYYTVPKAFGFGVQANF
jgi:TonB-linked SusC/RagA family outer membrane protein